VSGRGSAPPSGRQGVTLEYRDRTAVDRFQGTGCGAASAPAMTGERTTGAFIATPTDGREGGATASESIALSK
jgi:hypothetical protein